MSLSREATWDFEPNRDIRVGSHVAGGDVIGSVEESVLVKHRIIVPPSSCGTVTYIAPPGQYNVEVCFRFIVDCYIVITIHAQGVPQPLGRRVYIVHIAWPSW